MTAILITKHARPRIQIAQWIRNGKPVVAELQNRIAEQTALAANVRPKFLFHRAAAIASTGGVSLIPASEAGTRVRWRFAWRSGPYARRIRLQFEMAPQNAGAAGSNPYGLFEMLDGAGTVVGQSKVYFGASDGTLEDVPSSFGSIQATALEPDNEDNVLLTITPDTDYWGRFSDVNYARIVSVAVWEHSLEPNTDAGYPANTAGTGAPIFDEDRSDPVVMARTLWKKGGQQLINWCSETDATAPGQASEGFSGSLAASIGTFTLTSAGTVAGTPSYVSAAQSEGHEEALTVSWPTHESGDIGILAITTVDGPTPGDGAVTLSTPAGFELVGTSFYSGWIGTTAYWRRASSSSMTAPIIASTNNTIAATMHVIRGVVPYGLPFGTVYTDTTSGTDIEIVGGTSTHNNSMIFGILSATPEESDGLGDWTNSDLSAVTERHDDPAGGVETAIRQAVVTGIDVVAGSYGLTTAPDDHSAQRSSISFALHSTPAQAIPTVVSATVAGSSTSAITAIVPAAVEVDDIVLLIIESNGDAISLSTPSGFTEITDSPQSAGASTTRIAAYWNRATSTTMSNVVIADSGDHQLGIWVVIRGADYSGDPFDCTAGDTSAASTSVTMPSDTTTSNNCLIVHALASSISNTSSAWTNAGLSGLAVAIQNNTTSGDDGHVSVVTGGLAVAGAIGSTTATITSAAQARLTLAIRPA